MNHLFNRVHHSLEEESSESVCGPQLTERNVRLSGALPHLVWAFSAADSYITLIVKGKLYSTDWCLIYVLFCINPEKVGTGNIRLGAGVHNDHME